MKRQKKPDTPTTRGFVEPVGLDTPLRRLTSASQSKDGSLLEKESRAMLLKCQSRIRQGQRPYGKYIGEERLIEEPQHSADEGYENDPPKRHPYLGRLNGVDEKIMPDPTKPEARREFAKVLQLQLQKKLAMNPNYNPESAPKPRPG